MSAATAACPAGVGWTSARRRHSTPYVVSTTTARPRRVITIWGDAGTFRQEFAGAAAAADERRCPCASRSCRGRLSRSTAVYRAVAEREDQVSAAHLQDIALQAGLSLEETRAAVHALLHSEPKILHEVPDTSRTDLGPVYELAPRI
jgi:hypothetical protein